MLLISVSLIYDFLKLVSNSYISVFIYSYWVSRYQMPLALVGLISSLALWDIFKFCSERWGWDGYPVARQALIRTAQCGEFPITLILFFLSKMLDTLVFVCINCFYRALVILLNALNISPWGYCNSALILFSVYFYVLSPLTAKLNIMHVKLLKRFLLVIGIASTEERKVPRWKRWDEQKGCLYSASLREWTLAF